MLRGLWPHLLCFNLTLRQLPRATVSPLRLLRSVSLHRPEKLPVPSPASPEPSAVQVSGLFVLDAGLTASLAVVEAGASVLLVSLFCGHLGLLKSGVTEWVGQGDRGC